MSDMKMLRELLGSGALSESQAKAFKGMLQDLVDGRFVELTKAQRAWASQIHSDLDLAHKRVRLAPMPKPRRQWGAAPTVWEQPKPLKPPGRRS